MVPINQPPDCQRRSSFGWQNVGRMLVRPTELHLGPYIHGGFYDEEGPCRSKMELGSYRETALNARDWSFVVLLKHPEMNLVHVEFVIPLLDPEWSTLSQHPGG